MLAKEVKNQINLERLSCWVSFETFLDRHNSVEGHEWL